MRKNLQIDSGLWLLKQGNISLATRCKCVLNYFLILIVVLGGFAKVKSLIIFHGE